MGTEAKAAKTTEAPEEVNSDVAVTVAEPKAAVAPRRASMLSEIEQEVDRAFERMFSRDFLRPMRMGLPSLRNIRAQLDEALPRVDIIDREETLEVEAELPGVKKSDVDVAVNTDSITIKVKSESETEKRDDGDYYRHETNRRYAARSVMLPSSVDASRAKATLSDGVLSVSLPKTESSKTHSVTVD